MYRCVYNACRTSTFHPGNIHGPSSAPGPGRVPSLRLPRLAHDAALRHPAQAVRSGRHFSSGGPTSCPLSALRPPDLLHQQPVSHSGLLWRHGPSRGLSFIISYTSWLYIWIKNLLICFYLLIFLEIKILNLISQYTQAVWSKWTSNVLLLRRPFISMLYLIGFFIAEHQAKGWSSGSKGSDAVHRVRHPALERQKWRLPLPAWWESKGILLDVYSLSEGFDGVSLVFCVFVSCRGARGAASSFLDLKDNTASGFAATLYVVVHSVGGSLNFSPCRSSSSISSTNSAHGVFLLFLSLLSALQPERAPCGARRGGASLLGGGGTLPAFPADHSHPQRAR